MTLVVYKKSVLVILVKHRRKEKINKAFFNTLSKPLRENREKSKRRKVWFG